MASRRAWNLSHQQPGAQHPPAARERPGLEVAGRHVALPVQPPCSSPPWPWVPRGLGTRTRSHELAVRETRVRFQPWLFLHGLGAPRSSHASHRRRQCVGCSGTETPCHQGAEPAHGPGSRFNLYAGSRVCPPVGRGAHRRRGGGLPCPRPAHGLSAGQGLTQTALHPPGPHTPLLAAPAMRALETALVLSALLLLPAEAQNGRAPPSGAVGWRDGLSTSPFSMRT